MYTAAASSVAGQMLNNNATNDRSFTYFYNDGAMQEYGKTTQPVQQFSGFAILCHQKAYLDRIALGDTHAQAKANAGVKKYLKALQDAYAFLLGANPLKMCWATGHGVRSPCAMLHIDKQATGNSVYAGIFPYWVSLPVRYNNNTNVYFYNDTVHYDKGALTSGAAPYTDVELIPHRFARPRMSSYIPIGWLVEHTEFNLSKIYYLIGIALYLQHWEGSCVQSDGKKRLIARAA